MHDDTNESKYEVIKVEKTTTPEGMSGENWYLYVIQKGQFVNTIMECKKAGSLKSVTAHANEVAELINLRHVKGGRK